MPLREKLRTVTSDEQRTSVGVVSPGQKGLTYNRETHAPFQSASQSFTPRVWEIFRDHINSMGTGAAAIIGRLQTPIIFDGPIHGVSTVGRRLNPLVSTLIEMVANQMAILNITPTLL